MPAIFLPKHQKLILQCYPPGKGIEKKPNPSELSYLLYYASTRRVKLEKVITFLHKKTVSDSNRNKFGNLQVTLIIVSSLIEKCTENLNVFAPKAVAILQLALKNTDINLAKAILSTYGVLCNSLDSGLFVGDSKFVDSFSSLSKLIIDLGLQDAKAKSPSGLEWKLISLIASKHLSNVLGHNPDICREMLKKALPILITTIHDNDHSDTLINKLSHDGDIKLQKVQSSRTLKVQRHIEEDLENDSVDTEDIYQESISTLQAILNTSLTSQLSEVIVQVMNYTYESKDITKEWSERFLELCTTWTPVQLRYVVLGTIVAQLKRFSKGDKGLQRHYANGLLALVSSSVNMIGLSVSDIIQSILELQESLYLDPKNTLQTNDKDALSETFSDAVVNLSTHIYYYDQVPDSIYEIFIKVESTLEYYKGNDSKGLFLYIQRLLLDIKDIFHNLHSNSSDSTITRNYVGLDQWQIGLPLLSHRKDTTLYASLDQDQVDAIQLTYLKLFQEFIDHELVPTTILNDSDIKDEDKFLSPDFNQMISESTNFLSHFLIYVDKLLHTDGTLNLTVIKSVLKLSNDLSNIFGINFLNNYIPFYFHWTHEDLTKSDSKNDVVVDTFAQVLLNDALTNLDTHYDSLLNQYSTTSHFYKQLVSNINFKSANNLWCQELIEVNESSTNYVPLTSKELHEFILGNKFLTTWLNAQKPLILSEHLSSSKNGKVHEPNGNGILSDHLNGNGTVNGNGHVHTLNPDLTFDLSTSNDYADVRQGLGLGSVADIASIHSGLRNTTMNSGTFMNSSFEITNGSIFTNERTKPPKVSDLKDVLNDYNLKQPGGPLDHSNVTPGSILSKQIVTEDVDSILDGLNDDDESFVV